MKYRLAAAVILALVAAPALSDELSVADCIPILEANTRFDESLDAFTSNRKSAFRAAIDGFLEIYRQKFPDIWERMRTAAVINARLARQDVRNAEEADEAAKNAEYETYQTIMSQSGLDLNEIAPSASERVGATHKEVTQKITGTLREEEALWHKTLEAHYSGPRSENQKVMKRLLWRMSFTCEEKYGSSQSTLTKQLRKKLNKDN